jgi:hypothetical protein
MLREERRSERRYAVHQPAVLRIDRESVGEIRTVTENVSNGGVLLRSESDIPAGSKVEISLLLPVGSQVKAVGEVLRVERPSKDGPFLVAVKCDVPWEIHNTA